MDIALIATAVTFASLGALLAIFIGYPLALVVLAKVRPKPYPSGAEITQGRSPEELPRVAVLMAAHNEAARLPDKLASLQALDYPADRIRYYIADDASTDDTSDVLARLAVKEPRLVKVRSSTNVGKPINLNRLVERVDMEGGADVLVFCDARQPLDPAAIRALVAPLDDPNIGGATGDLVLPPGPGNALQGMGAYWCYETLMRTREAAIGSVIGATGALYAVRRPLFVPFEPVLVLDDMLLPLRVALSGHRFVFAHGAQAYDVYSRDLEHEFSRKSRTLGGIWQAMALERRLLLPGTGVFLSFLFHKFGRVAFPWLMLWMLVGNIVALAASEPGSLLNWPLWGLLAVQVAFHCGAFIAQWLHYSIGDAGRLSILRTIYALMLAALVGWWRWREGTITAAWKPREARR